MKCKSALLLSSVLLFSVLGGFDAFADGRKPASCLLYPYFNTATHENLSIITVTNRSDETVHLRIVFISEDNDCLPKDYWRTLTGYDTFTFIDSGLNNKEMKGFLYIYAVEKYGSAAEKKHDYLVGQEFIFAVWKECFTTVQYGINAVPFAVGERTVNGDGKLQLNGLEYEPAPNKIVFPRFFGQTKLLFKAKVILINLTGGKYFTANIEIKVFDDSEHETSDTLQIPCFWYGCLESAAVDVTEEYLQFTSTDLDEIYDGSPPPPAGNPHKKTGWLEFVGVNAHYLTNSFNNPGIYGVLLERIGIGFAADLPWEIFDPVNNAMLWSTSPDGT